MRILNQKGMSLAQVMVALGLTGVLSMVIMKNMSMQSKAQKTIELQSNVNDLRRILQDFVARGEPCNASFGGAARGQPILALRQKESYSGKVFAEVGKEFQSSKIIIKSMQLLDLKLQRKMNEQNGGDSGAIDPNSAVGMAVLKVEIQKMTHETGEGKSIYGSADSAIFVPIIAEFMGDDIIGNGSNESLAYQDWERLYNEEITLVKSKAAADGIPYPEVAVNPELATLPKHDDIEFKPGGKYSYAYTNAPGSDVTLTWSFSHPYNTISDCGSHLSK